MSIRYTLRHNIPNKLVSAENHKYEVKNKTIEEVYGQDYTEEDVTNFSKLREEDYDFNLLRKHELAETDDNRVVYRQKDNKIVDWTEEATKQAEAIRDECLAIKDDATAYMNQIETELNDIIDDSEQQQQEVQRLIGQVENMIDLDAMTDSEIDAIVIGDGE